jgi:putative DNA primase/helicase
MELIRNNSLRKSLLIMNYEMDVPWWLTPVEEKCLEHFNASHKNISAIQERIMAAVDMGRAGNLPAMTATEVLIRIGIKNPTNPQSKECAAVLRELFGDSKRINGQNKWRIPFKEQNFQPSLSNSEEGIY